MDELPIGPKLEEILEGQSTISLEVEEQDLTIYERTAGEFLVNVGEITYRVKGTEILIWDIEKETGRPANEVESSELTDVLRAVVKARSTVLVSTLLS